MAARRLIVLVIEDDGEIRATFQRALRDRGYVAEVGRKTVDVVRDIRATPPDAVVVDLRLAVPAVGWEILAAIRADRRLAGLPLVAASDDDMPTHEQAAILDQLRVVLIRKPMLVDDLLVAIEDARLLAAQRGRALLDWRWPDDW